MVRKFFDAVAIRACERSPFLKPKPEKSNESRRRQPWPYPSLCASIVTVWCLVFTAFLLLLSGWGTNIFFLQPGLLLGDQLHSASHSFRADLSRSKPTTTAVQVVENKEGFPSFLNYGGQPIAVSYDDRSILLDGDRALFIGGSMHPSRATKQTWEAAVDEAVHQGLNLITICVFWAAHQPMKELPLNWTLQRNVSCGEGEPSFCDWDLAQAIGAVASRGLFVHIRIGPYICAEYNYGGIPEWLPLMHPNMSMRRPNKEWMTVMEDYVTNSVVFLTEHKLFAYQGGPIILAQIENELGGEVNVATDNLLQVDRFGNFINDTSIRIHSQVARNATLQDYADWCGDLVQRLAPEVVWTMCSGLSANSTITTYNGFLDDVGWLEQHGESGRIQVNQPAMWSEDEGNYTWPTFMSFTSHIALPIRIFGAF